MITPEPPAGSEHYREGWRHGYEQAAIDRERSADAVRPVPDTGQARSNRLLADMLARKERDLIEMSEEVDRLRNAAAVPDTGQTREQILQRDITFGEYVIAVCDAIGLPHHSPRAAVVEAIRAAVAAAQAPESPTASTPKAGRGGSGEAETATGPGRAPDVPRNEQELIAWQHQEADRLRALLGTATTPDRLAWISKAGETAAADRQARYQETACALRPAATSGDPDAADLAYARSEVDKWLASHDPYCILPTRTEHIPALLARLDELEGTR